jgi:hypothetical protein
MIGREFINPLGIKSLFKIIYIFVYLLFLLLLFALDHKPIILLILESLKKIFPIDFLVEITNQTCEGPSVTTVVTLENKSRFVLGRKKVSSGFVGILFGIPTDGTSKIIQCV